MSDTTNTHLPTLTRDGAVFTIDLGDTENRMNAAWVDAFEAAVDEVAAAQGPAALLTTARGKFWSNGLDLDWLMSEPAALGPFGTRLERVVSRLLTLGMPTVAAIQGHCFGAGAMLALAHDYRVMRADRGYFCFPEVDIQLPFPPGVVELIIAKLPVATAREAMITGRRYGGDDAVVAGIADTAATEDAVASTARAAVAELAAKAGPNLGAIKAGLYHRVVAALA